jgi:hypothetical protein
MKLYFNARLIAKGPVTTGPRILVEVANQQNESANLDACTCELCRNQGIHTQTIPEHQQDEHR